MTTNLTFSEWIIETLLQLGVTQFVISPGSRSTPLTVAAARNPKTRTRVHFDERGAAYFALGYARSSGKPAVLICTSGTAVANYFPAVIEASLDNIPLIILSADRPPELIDVGANQAIFQDNIYGNYPRLFKNLEPPGQATGFEEVSGQVSEIFHAALSPRPGPVHLNCQFREPLLPTHPLEHTDILMKSEILVQSSLSAQYDGILAANNSLLKYGGNNSDDLQNIKDKIAGTSLGIIILGRSINPRSHTAILHLARSLHWPVFPDVQSTLRFSQHPNLINHFDLALLRDRNRDQKPEIVIHLGGAFTSKRLLNYLNTPDIFYISVKPTSERIDPNHQVDIALQADIESFCRSVEPTAPHDGRSWLQTWQQTELEMTAHISKQLESRPLLNEPGISYYLSQNIPSNHDLMLANSMAIREMEMFGSISGSLRRVFANRGASGIDGLLATAAGYQQDSDAPLTLLIGDLAVLHDLNSLSLISLASHPIILILINNNGGGIFSFLPIRSETDVFNTFFGTPHGWTFEKAAEMFKLSYTRPGNMAEFQQVYSDAVKGPSSLIIELQTDRSDNYGLHQAIFRAIRES